MKPLRSPEAGALLFSLQQNPTTPQDIYNQQWTVLTSYLDRYLFKAAATMCNSHKGEFYPDKEEDVKDIVQTVYCFLLDPKRPRFNPERGNVCNYVMGLLSNAGQKVLHLRGTPRRKRSNDCASPGDEMRKSLISCPFDEEDLAVEAARPERPQTAQIEDRELLKILVDESDSLALWVFSQLAQNDEGTHYPKDTRLKDLAAQYGLSRDQLNYRLKITRTKARQRMDAIEREAA